MLRDRSIRFIQKFHGTLLFFFFFQAEDGIRDYKVTGVQTCALPISQPPRQPKPLKHRSAHLTGWGLAASKKRNSAKAMRSEERRVGKECRSRWSPYH